jgi:hypothetical protein
MKLILVATALFIALNAYARATTIVVFWGPTDIIIGADSKLSHLEYSGDDLACKIGVVRNVIWAAAGVLSFNDNTSVADIVNGEMNKGLEIRHTVDNIVETLRIRLSLVLDTVKRTNTLESMRNRLSSSIIFGYLENGVANIDFNEIKLPPSVGSADLQITRQHCPQANDTRCDIRNYLIGKVETIKAEEASDHNVIQRLGMKGAIDHFVEEESTVNPNTVSGPVAIVHLSSNGIEWIEKGKCDNP